MTHCHVWSLSSYAKTAQSWKFMKYWELEMVENMAVIWSQTEHHHLGLYFPNFIVYTGWDHQINSECFKNAGSSTNSAVISLSLVGIREFTTLASRPTNFLFWFQISCFFSIIQPVRLTLGVRLQVLHNYHCLAKLDETLIWLALSSRIHQLSRFLLVI